MIADLSHFLCQVVLLLLTARLVAGGREGNSSSSLARASKQSNLNNSGLNGPMLLSTVIFVEEPSSKQIKMYSDHSRSMEEQEYLSALLLTNHQTELEPEGQVDQLQVGLMHAVDPNTLGIRLDKLGAHDFIPATNELSLGFVQLFDQLWLIKRSGTHALVTLEYFTPVQHQNQNQQHQQKRPNHTSRPAASPSTSTEGSGSTSTEWAVTSRPPLVDRPTQTSRPNNSNQQVALGAGKLGAHLKQQSQSLWTRLNSKLQRLMGKMWPKRERQMDPEPGAEEQPEEITVDLGGQSSNVELSRRRRQQSCMSPSESQVSQCKITESFVGANLNGSFPGTGRSIEDNCHKISYLLAMCWPSKLAQLRASLGSRNESAPDFGSDFPIPVPGSSGQPESCGVEASLSEPVMDRVSWMWLNLCMDRRFRLDYISHLKCLGLWTHERARLVCNNEFRRMALHTLGSGSSSSLSPPGTAAAVVGGSRLDESGREIESKTICCAFDHFLRCVHRQTVRDCGRQGGQFVVNFMSRVGNDDMKYICNSEPRALNRAGKGHQPALKMDPLPARPTESRKPQERGPFIESGYCAELKVTLALLELPGQQVSEPPGAGYNHPDQLNSCAQLQTSVLALLLSIVYIVIDSLRGLEPL